MSRDRNEYMRAYMKGWRARQPKKRNPNLDRSKPVGIKSSPDPTDYARQYMRWWRAQRSAASNNPDMSAPICVDT